MVTTGGPVFCAGTQDLKIRAFDSRNGSQLWEYELPLANLRPKHLQVKAKQCVVVSATGGGKLGGALGDAYIARFAVSGNATNCRKRPFVAMGCIKH